MSYSGSGIGFGSYTYNTGISDGLLMSELFSDTSSKVDGFLTLQTPKGVKEGGIVIDSFQYPSEGHTEHSLVHISSCFSLRIVTSGKGSHLWNGEKCDLRRGNVFLLTPNTPHRLDEGKMQFLTISFSEESIYSSFLDIIGTKGPLVAEYNSIELEELVKDAEHIKNEYKSISPFADEMNRSILTRILISFFRKCQVKPSDSPLPENPAVRCIMSYIMHYFRTDISLRDLAELVGITPNYLGEIFIQTTGVSCSAYVRDLRLSFARQLLRGTSFSISDISEICGFNSSSYFVRLFREVYKITPLQYRRTGLLLSENM